MLAPTLPEGHSEEFRYDAKDRQSLHVLFEGVVTESVYDTADGRLVAKHYDDTLTA